MCRVSLLLHQYCFHFFSLFSFALPFYLPFSTSFLSSLFCRCSYSWSTWDVDSLTWHERPKASFYTIQSAIRKLRNQLQRTNNTILRKEKCQVSVKSSCLTGRLGGTPLTQETRWPTWNKTISDPAKMAGYFNYNCSAQSIADPRAYYAEPQGVFNPNCSQSVPVYSSSGASQWDVSTASEAPLDCVLVLAQCMPYQYSSSSTLGFVDYSSSSSADISSSSDDLISSSPSSSSPSSSSSSSSDYPSSSSFSPSSSDNYPSSSSSSGAKSSDSTVSGSSTVSTSTMSGASSASRSSSSGSARTGEALSLLPVCLYVSMPVCLYVVFVCCCLHYSAVCMNVSCMCEYRVLVLLCTSCYRAITFHY